MRERSELRVPGLAEPISDYTDAVRAGDLLFISGCVPAVPGARIEVEAVAFMA